MSEIAIRVSNLRRSFGNVDAVQGISFEIQKGSVCGFVGANGAGKTTTMRILATLDYATSGKAEICGIDVMDYPNLIREKLGWMPDYFGHYNNMTVLEYIDFYARAYGFCGMEREARVREVMEFTDLTGIMDRASNKLSKGMTQRLCLARTMLHDPEVLILDEPAAGLDPKARVELKSLIRLLSQEGKTIFISSHILSELGEMCDSMIFVNHGKIVHHGDAESLRTKNQKGGQVYSVKMIGNPDQIESWSINNPYTELIDLSINGGRIRIDDESNPERSADILASMIKDGIRVTEFHKEQRNLEDAFIDILAETNAN
jgi:ABC-2 type transport system ATP-binding protein